MWITSPPLKRRRWTVDLDSSMPIAALQLGNSTDRALQSVTAMRTKWRYSRAVVTLRGPVLVFLCVKLSFIHWFHTRITFVAASLYETKCHGMKNLLLGDQPFCPFELTRVLILHLSISTSHTSISFHVSTSLASSAQIEQGITLTLLMRGVLAHAL
jgi:hypothetical protein